MTKNKSVYDKAFFDELYIRLNAKHSSQKKHLKNIILRSEKTYYHFEKKYKTQLPPGEVKKELRKILSHLTYAEKSLGKIFESNNYGSVITNNLYEIILKDFPSFHGVIGSLRMEEDVFTIIKPRNSLQFIQSFNAAIKTTLKAFSSPKFREKKSDVLNWWLISLAYPIEEAIGRPLEQSHHYKETGGYAAKRRKQQDSELILFLLKPINPKATISQIETALKETKKERLLSHKDEDAEDDDFET